MKATLVVAAAWFACLRFVCLAQSPGGLAGVSLTTCSSAAAAATAAATITDVEGAGTGCDETTEPFTGIPGTARERSFFVSGSSIAKDTAVVVEQYHSTAAAVEIEVEDSLVASGVYVLSLHNCCVSSVKPQPLP